jgi:hypothetical protein
MNVEVVRPERSIKPMEDLVFGVEFETDGDQSNLIAIGYYERSSDFCLVSSGDERAMLIQFWSAFIWAVSYDFKLIAFDTYALLRILLQLSWQRSVLVPAVAQSRHWHPSLIDLASEWQGSETEHFTLEELAAKLNATPPRKLVSSSFLDDWSENQHLANCYLRAKCITVSQCAEKMCIFEYRP